jgi:hypothetical protein
MAIKGNQGLIKGNQGRSHLPRPKLLSQCERPLPSALLGLGLGETIDPMRELGPVVGHHVRRAHLGGKGGGRGAVVSTGMRGGGLRARGAVVSTSIAFGAAW